MHVLPNEIHLTMPTRVRIRAAEKDLGEQGEAVAVDSCRMEHLLMAGRPCLCGLDAHACAGNGAECREEMSGRTRALYQSLRRHARHTP